MDDVKALVFDVFGTVVDWRSSIAKHAAAFGAEQGIEADWTAFADGWRGKYQPYMNKVRTGELPWTKLDVLHRMGLVELLGEFGINDVGEHTIDELTMAWHYLDPWPDAPSGLSRLKAKYIIGTMSNGNVALMTNMAKYAGLPWDVILGAELAQAYKPDPKTYLTGVELLGLYPEQVMMVAAHQNDLLAAGAEGLKTAFVPRPMEFGPARKPDPTPDPSFDIVAADFRDLASQMGV
ncbi:MAG: haloacid dehalogenase type II [Chloroflexi bacterium]|nr:haloacid dehalogenase type II [Chloroflexota bacterium]MYE41549.1 haloacid dehalogenase type II [Chloroflexota bacterium]